ncbi:Hermansky-Pudlak syndrome 3 protein-like [Amphibalanus amphitrite]|uniref:Hermansky-Pudlak syndrome 3 protein-like n=1 Tax=Amphibalanus amphitrite TaxID=1232801 RepID=UPI001C8FCF82|nr:Hermansky-Pudlak syndrome 3 protein-like [Amphibalanus amphitrite]
MVHVIDAHHFGGQQVVTIDHPLSITTGPDNILFVATADHSLHILDITTGEPVKPPFSTVDAAVSICYSQYGDYVAALEAKEARNSPDFSYIRVYRHWSQQERAQPMRARIAARVTPPSSGADPTLEMIEVPINEHATAIACCQRTGNLAVACGSLVTVHQFVLKAHDISKFQFGDLEEVVQLELPFEVTELALCEELLLCAGADRLQLLRLRAEPAAGASGSERPRTEDPPEEDGEEDLEEDDDLQIMTWDPALPAARLTLPALHRPLPTAADAGPAPRLLVPAGRPQISAESLLYWREPDGESLVGGALCLTPFYQRAETGLTNGQRESGAAGGLHSAERGLLSAVSVFFSSSHEGRLYLVAPLRPADGPPAYAALVGSHSYTSPLLLAAREAHMLHAVTHTGLESYTVRDTRRLSRLERPTEPCPDPAEAGFLLGIRPFVNVTHMCVGDGVLVLAASGPEDSDSATLYLLRLPPPEELYAECARLGGTHGHHAPAMCQALLEEAHMVLRPAVRWQLGRPPSDRLIAEYNSSAANVGYYLLRSSSEQDWPRATPWLQLAATSVEDVLTQCAEAPGLESYLSSALSAADGPPLSYQTANQALSVLSFRAPDALAGVLLAAGPLVEFRAEPPLEALEQLLEETELSEPAAQAARLAALLLLARTGGGTAERRAPLALLADGRPDLLAAGLAALAAAGRPPLAELTGLLLEAADTSDRRAALRYELLLRDVLERHLQAGGRPQRAGQAVTLLVRMYLGGTVGAFPPAGAAPATGPALERHRLGALYGPRAAWLNLVPPFAGRAPAQILADMEADPRLVDLVMLQSLLCSDLPSAEDRRHIREFLSAHPSAVGHDALLALCSELADAAALLAEKYPEAALEHAKERCRSPSDWRTAVQALSAAQQTAEPDGGQQGALAALLDHLASTVPPDQLRLVLAERADQHGAALLRCHNVQRADVVRAEVMRMA